MPTSGHALALACGTGVLDHAESEGVARTLARQPLGTPNHPFWSDNARVNQCAVSAPTRSERIRQLPARPKNTTTTRPSLTMSWSARRPIRSPSLERGTVVTLSTIKLLASLRPF